MMLRMLEVSYRGSDKLNLATILLENLSQELLGNKSEDRQPKTMLPAREPEGGYETMLQKVML